MQPANIQLIGIGDIAVTATVSTHAEAKNSIEELKAEFAPLFDRIAEGALQREEQHQLPFEQVRWLKNSGFTALRIPVEFGGRGIALDAFLELLLSLSIADSNIAHLLRGHIAHVESLLLEPDSDHRRVWLSRLAHGDLIGNAASERTELTEITTKLTQLNNTLVVNGSKYYTTGSIYADWISLSALEGEQRVSLLVNTADPGVSIVDDWDGFGQQLTGSGSLTLTNVSVERSNVKVYTSEDPHTGFRVGLFQTILLVVAAGIAQASVRDAVKFVKPRKRTFAVAGEKIPAQEQIVQSVIGDAESKAYSSAAIVLRLAKSLQNYAQDGGKSQSANQLVLDVFKGQQTVLKLVTEAATEIFEVGGASATSTSLRLDRHWRNARTIASHNPAKYRAIQVGAQLLTGEFELYGKRV